MSEKPQKEAQDGHGPTATPDSGGIRVTRRGLLTGAAVGTALVGTATVAKKVSSLLPTVSPQEAYLKDIRKGDMAVKGWRLTLMTEGEKKDLISFFKNNYRYMKES